MPTELKDNRMLTESTAIAPGAQEFFLPGGSVGVLIIHGYGGSIGDYRTFGEALRTRGYTVLGMRVAGHGESLDALRNSSSADWQASVLAAARRLRQSCGRIIVVGSSFGGALAINYVRQFPDRVQALVVINPAIRYRAGGNFQTIALKILRLFTPYYRKSGLTQADLKLYRQLGSMTHWPIDGIFETYRYINRMVLPHLARIHTPTLVMAIEHDPIVHTDSAKIIHEQIGTNDKKLVWLPGKTHRPFRDARLVGVMINEIQTFIDDRLPTM